jgi:hypothetical protein
MVAVTVTDKIQFLAHLLLLAAVREDVGTTVLDNPAHQVVVVATEILTAVAAQLIPVSAPSVRDFLEAAANDSTPAEITATGVVVVVAQVE